MHTELQEQRGLHSLQQAISKWTTAGCNSLFRVAERNALV